MTNKTKTYAENYAILEEINYQLQQGQNNPNMIDELAPMLEKASKSYLICKERIAAAEKFIAEFENKNNL
ncbi:MULTISPECIES: exodeoxyribonuclease VII small subunit [Cysteiniphilum]|uniref:exodeoxyribonuclease VII small subunit n=1 Tax=Cysteiniphilum TaxID=2056696 RepID=UPI00177B27E7|nr:MULTISPECIES: exodeoxyribonuclease VII small subunit [Cysteiniphilum]